MNSMPASHPPSEWNRSGLPAWTNRSQAFFDLEMAELLLTHWQLVGHITGVPETGDCLSFNLGTERALVLRGKDGQIRAFSLPRFLEAGLFQKLDRSKLPGWKNLDLDVLRIMAGWDPDYAYGIPYMWGSVGLAYNLDMVKERLPDADLTSLDMLPDPDNAAKLSDCGISLLDSPTDVLLLILKCMGSDPDKATAADYQAAADRPKPIRPYIRIFDNTNFANALPSRELCMADSWSGDYSTARARAEEAGITDLHLAYFVLKTGAPAWVDAMSIPSDAQNADNAHIFLDYQLQPEVIAKCSSITNYANGNRASKPCVDPKILANPAVYPDDATKKLLWAPAPLTDEQSQAITRIWTEMKAG